MGLLGVARRATLLLLLVGLLILKKASGSCDDVPECRSISIQTTTSQITVANMGQGFALQNITYLNGTVPPSSSISNNVSVTGLPSGTRFSLQYGNSSLRCCQNVTTKPIVINQLRESTLNSDSISLTWNKPDEYNSDYSYRVQTNSSAGLLINETIVRSESVTVTNLIPGETYTFTVFTRAADAVTESQPASYTTCTLPGAPQNISVQHYNSTNSLLVTWIEPPGKVSDYNVTLRGVDNQTTQTNSPRVNFTDLLPGREYSVTILTVSGTCSQTSDPVKEATYPTPPGSITFSSIGTNSISLSWGDPINMTNTEKFFNVTYRTSSDTRSVSSNVSNINLQNRTSGTKYTISVVTVGAREYQSSAVSRDVYTKPMVINQLRKNNLTSESISLTWNKSDEYNSDYSYRVQTNSSVGMLINETIVRSESVTVTNLIPGETYTFTVFTRAADGATESQPASYTTCTLPGAPQNISVQHYNSTNSLLVTWIEPPGKVSDYNVTLRGVVNQTTQTNSPRVNFTDLLPGRDYSVTILTVSGTCSQTSDPVKEATYPTPPGSITFSSIGTNSISLSWGDPINMTNTEKFFNITYRTSSDTRSVSSNVSNINLQNRTSGTKYTISVVTVGAREYQSSAVSRDVYTIPMVINQLRKNNLTSESISLTWNKSDEYNSDYSYRVQTNSSAGMLINETIVRSESVTVTNLIPGETYTFTVFTRAADGVTESQPVSYTTCTLPGAPQNISVQHYNSTNSLLVTWIEPPGKVSDYNVTLRGVINQTTQTNSPRVNFTDLLPGREYSVTILTVSGTCSQTSDPVKEATYPTPPGSITFSSIGTNSISLSWGDPINMTNTEKFFNITYRTSSDTRSVSSNVSNINLQNLTSGTKYTISVVTVGAREYQSSAVSRDVYTKPMVINQLQKNNLTSESISLTWNKSDEYNSDYSYRVQTNSSVGMLINETIVRSESVTVTNLTPGETYTFTVFTRAADGVTESQPASYTTCTLPGAPQNISVQHYNSTNSFLVTWIEPPGKVSDYNVTLRGVVNQTAQINSPPVNFTDLLPGRDYSVTILTVSGTCSRTSDPVTEATYPTPPGAITSLSTGTSSVSFSWGDPIDMKNATKSFNVTYKSSSGTWSVPSNVSNINLQNLTSGTKYTISVVTVGAREYQSSAVSRDVYTNPMPVKNLRARNVTSGYVFLIWDKPDEYNSDYSYRVQTNSSAGMLINETIVKSESVTVTNLIPGETYTFTVFTRVADGVTESQPASYTTCTLPGAPQNISVQHYNSTNSLLVTWIEPPGKVSDYNVTLRGVVNQTTQTNSPRVNFTDLLPGREYSVTILTVSGTCSQTSDPVKEATYPTPPGSITFSSIGTNSISLSWGDPINMTNTEKFFNITYRTSSDTRSVSSNVSNINLQNRTSGTKYTISVVTVGAREYQSSAVSRDVYTIPMVINQLRKNNLTSESISLTWNKSDEYNSDYSYRVQTNSSAGMLINETIVRSESVTVTNLTPGETYTFTVFTRAADAVTESQPASYTTCTLPGAPQNISVQHYNSTNSLLVTWIEPPGKVSDYNVTLRGVDNQTTQTNSPRVNFTDLLPGRDYSVTILTVSGTCSQTSDPVKEATYPTTPGSITFSSIGTNSISLSWGDPINMTNTEKFFNITYRTSSDTRSVSSNVSNMNLQNLTSGTKYTISVVTVGAREYQSSAVSRDVYTKPMVINQLRKNNLTSESISLTWNKSDEYNSDYSYRVQTNSSAGMLINETIVRSESVTVTNLTPGETFTFTVFTRAADGVTESQPVSYMTCTLPGAPQNISVQHYNSTNSLLVTWIEPPGKVSDYNVTLRGVVNQTTQTNSPRVNFTDLLPGRDYSVTILTVSGTCSQTSDPVTEATYPTTPGAITSLSTRTSSVSFSWGDPIDMKNATKSFNVTYKSSSGTWSVPSNVSNINLQNLTSGTKYTISVVTVGAREYQSSAVSRDVYTNPMPVKNLRARNVTSGYVFLIWDKPDEYNSDYSYRVQSNSSAGNLVNETTVRSELFNVTNLVAGETYTFTVFTRADDNITESQPASYTTCTVPGLVGSRNIQLTNMNFTNFLQVKWTKSDGIVSYYNVTLNGDINRTIQTNSTTADFPNLLPGRKYSVIIQTVSGTCSQTSDPVTEATYPTPPGAITSLSTETSSVSFSWGDPIDMKNATKSFNVTYKSSSGTWSVLSNVSNINLQNLTSGTKYTISVVTVGAREYQSSAVSRDVYTNPMLVKNLRARNVTSGYVFLIWDKPDEYNSDYSYRVQTNSSAGNLVNETTVRSELFNVTNLVAGETYTFTVFTRAGDNITESQPASYTTCTVPGLVGSRNIQLTNMNFTNFLQVKWTKSDGIVSYYNVTLNGDINRTIQTNSTTADFPNLLPGRKYSVIIQTVSGTCSQTSDPVTEATYPTPPGAITSLSTETSSVSFSWGDPIDMKNATKSFNVTYKSSSGTWSVPSNVSNINLQNLTSGTKYTISVVTVGAREYQSSAVSRDVYTNPMLVKNLRARNVTSGYVFLIWDKPDEYNSDYSYRVQTNSSAGNLVNETTVRSELFNVTNLVAGETYTFTVFTRAGDNITESQPASYTTCTVPGLVGSRNIQLTNMNFTNFLQVKWTKSDGIVSYYNVTLNGDINRTIQTNSTTADFPNLLPGRKYSVIIQTVSGTCSQTSDPVTEATYPTPPGAITSLSTETSSVSFSWGDPIDMKNATKSFNVTYKSSSGTWSVPSNVSNINLQNLTSGTKYTISVVTVGAREYQSSAVSRDVYTNPMLVKNLRARNVTSGYVFLIWDKPDEYNSDYSYRVQTNSSAGNLVNETTVRSELFNVTNLVAGETYTFTVFTRAGDNITESQPASYTTCTVPGLVGSRNIQLTNMNFTNFLQVKWTKSDGIVSYYNVTLNGDINRTIQTNSTTADFPNLLPGRKYSVIIQTVSGTCSQTSDPVTEATYPTPPGAITSLSTRTSSVSFSWGDPIDMKNATKSFNVTYKSSSGTWSVLSNMSNINLQNLTSGTKYTISVVTVGALEYQSSAVSRDVYTTPMSVKNLRARNVTSGYVFLIWDKPDEYNSDYSYRVQTNSSAGNLINETTVRSELFNVTNLVAGETYTFTVFTRAGDNITESQPASYTTCTVPGLVGSRNIQLTNMNFTNFLQVKWTKSDGIVSYYNVTLNGDINRTIQTNSTTADFPNLLPGRKYSVIIQTVSGTCSQTSDPVTEATYPTPPGAITSLSTETSSVSFSWGDPIDMKNATKSFNVTYKSSSGTWSVPSNVSNINLQNLTSGTKYTISVVTVGAREYQSSAVSRDVYTNPMLVKNLRARNVTSGYVFLIWDKPDEYNSDYSYRVQTNSSAGNLVNETTVRSELFNVTNLVAGETYTFTVFTRAGDNITESQPASYTTCTVPGLVGSRNIQLTNMNFTNFLQVKWTKSDGIVSYYNVTLNGDINRTIQTNSTTADFPNLLPGRKYSVIIQTVSGTCSQTSDPVTEATYPTPPGAITSLSTGTSSVSFSWGDPIDMKNATKSFNVTYKSSSGTWSVLSNVSNINLQNLTSGTKYTISVVTVGAQEYQSSAVSEDVCTVPAAVLSFSCAAVSGQASLSLRWTCPDTLFTNFDLTLTSQGSFRGLNISRNCSAGSPEFNVTGLMYFTEYSISITTLACKKASDAKISSCQTSIGRPPDINTQIIEPAGSSLYDQFDITFREFNDSNGPIVAYAVIVTVGINVTGQKPGPGILSKTYSDHKTGSTNTYVAHIVDTKQRTTSRNGLITVRVGDGSSTLAYTNGPLAPLTSYWISIAGFTAVDYNNRIIMEDKSLLSYCPYSSEFKTPENTGVIIGAVVGCILGVAAISIMGSFIWWKRRQGGKKKSDFSENKMKDVKKSQSIRCVSFASHFAKQQADTNLGFSREYERLASVGVTQSRMAAEDPENRRKNRYTNVLPYDVSRVKLSIKDNPTDDYINANYIPGYRSDKEFIAAQGPLPHTVNDFWRMIWEKNIRTIVIVTKCVESGKVKCEEYWPTGQAVHFDRLVVSFKGESVFPEWTIRNFTVTNKTNKEIQVRQFHFTAWPDHGVPKTANILISFRNIVCDYTKLIPDSPILVHCSAGVGRTGTFIALDRVIRQIEAEDKLDIFGAVYDLRMHRVLMVQTESQYIFLNQCALDFIKAKEDKPDLIYQNTAEIYENIYPSLGVSRTNI